MCVVQRPFLSERSKSLTGHFRSDGVTAQFSGNRTLDAHERCASCVVTESDIVAILKNAKPEKIQLLLSTGRGSLRHNFRSLQKAAESYGAMSMSLKGLSRNEGVVIFSAPRSAQNLEFAQSQSIPECIDRR